MSARSFVEKALRDTQQYDEEHRMKLLTEEITAPFIKEINDLCGKHNVMLTGHCTFIGYGEAGDAAINISNAPTVELSTAKAAECLQWYKDGKFREHIRQ